MNIHARRVQHTHYIYIYMYIRIWHVSSCFHRPEFHWRCFLPVWVLKQSYSQCFVIFFGLFQAFLLSSIAKRHRLSILWLDAATLSTFFWSILVPNKNINFFKNAVFLGGCPSPALRLRCNFMRVFLCRATGGLNMFEYRFSLMSGHNFPTTGNSCGWRTTSDPDTAAFVPCMQLKIKID